MLPSIATKSWAFDSAADLPVAECVRAFRDKERLAFAERELGVAHTIDVEAVDSVRELQQLTEVWS